MKPEIPSTPKKAPPKQILPSSRYYTNNNENNNLIPENLNVKSVDINTLVEQVKLYPGNKKIPSTHPNLNYKQEVPKLKLPPQVRGGKHTRKTKRSMKRTLKHRRGRN